MESAARKNRPTKHKAITIEDNDASNGQAKVVKQEEPENRPQMVPELLKKIADLEQSLAKKDKTIENAGRMIGEAKSKAEFLETLVDQKNAVLNGGKKIEELEKSVTDLTKEVESRGDRINELSSKLKDTEDKLEALANQQERMGEDKQNISFDGEKEARELRKELAELKTQLIEERKRSNEKVAELSTELNEERERSSDVMRRLQQLQQPPAANGIPAEELAVPNEIDRMGGADLAMDNSFVGLPSNNNMHDLRNDSQETGGGSGGKRRSSRNTTKPVKNIYSKEDSDEDGGPPVKKSKSESGKNIQIKKQSSLKKDRSESAIEREAKKNETELECFECDYRTKTVSSFFGHLKRNHNTNLVLAGRALLCECGHECHSQMHNYKCDIAQFTLIRKKSGPIQRLNDEKVTPKCILCEKYPQTVSGYAEHLREYHNSTTLNENGIYLTCACGVKLSSRYLKDHNGECDGRRFTLHKTG